VSFAPVKFSRRITNCSTEEDSGESFSQIEGRDSEKKTRESHTPRRSNQIVDKERAVASTNRRNTNKEVALATPPVDSGESQSNSHGVSHTTTTSLIPKECL